MKSATKLLVVLPLGIVAGGLTAIFGPWQMALPAGWIAAAAAHNAKALHAMYHADGATTERESTREDDSRTLRGLIVTGACLASLLGAGAALHKASNVDETLQAFLLTAVSLVTVVVSWVAINLDYTLRYADLYYQPPVGGIDFPETDQPDYRDFAYLAFTIGMTYQVSDTDLLTKKIRRTVLWHALVSYLFGVVIVAAIINVTAGFVT